MFVCCDADDYQRTFRDSMMVKVLERYANTINILVTVPPARPPRPPLPCNFPASNICSQDVSVDGASGFEDNFVEKVRVSRTDDAATVPSAQHGAGVGSAEGINGELSDRTEVGVISTDMTSSRSAESSTEGHGNEDTGSIPSLAGMDPDIAPGPRGT